MKKALCHRRSNNYAWKSSYNRGGNKKLPHYWVLFYFGTIIFQACLEIYFVSKSN